MKPEEEELSPLSTQTRASEAVAAVLADIDDETLDKISYTWEDLFSSCQYNGRPCDEDRFAHSNSALSKASGEDWLRDFTSVRDPDYGKCYTFNARLQPIHFTKRTGPHFGETIFVGDEVRWETGAWQGCGCRC